VRGRRGAATICGLGLAGLLGSVAPEAPRAQVAPPPAAPSPPSTPAGPAPPAPTPTVPTPGRSRPGTPAPSQVVQELQATLAQGIQRFEAKDLNGVLALISDKYWTGPFTKSTVRAQLLTMFQVNQQVRAKARIDEVRMVGELAWVYSTGDVSGQLPLVGHWVTLLWWERELEIARRENGAWRLYGYQQ